MVAAFNSDKAVIKKTFQTGKSFLGELYESLFDPDELCESTPKLC